MEFMTIYDYFPNTLRSEIDKIIDTLSPRAIEVLKLKYGESYKRPKLIYELSEEDNEYFEKNILYVIRKRLIKKTRRIYDYFPLETKDDIDYIIKTLSPRAQQVLKLQFGSDFQQTESYLLDDQDLTYFQTYILKTIRLRLKSLKDGKSLKPTNIYEYFLNYTFKEINNALEYLPKNQLNIIYKKYGEDLLNPDYTNKLTLQESRSFSQTIIPKINKILLRIRENLEIENNKKKDKCQKVINILIQCILNKLLEVFTYDEAIIIILKLILNYDTKVISNLLNVSEEFVLDVSKRFLNIYKEQMIKDINREEVFENGYIK